MQAMRMRSAFMDLDTNAPHFPKLMEGLRAFGFQVVTSVQRPKPETGMVRFLFNAPADVLPIECAYKAMLVEVTLNIGVVHETYEPSLMHGAPIMVSKDAYSIQQVRIVGEIL